MNNVKIIQGTNSAPNLESWAHWAMWYAQIEFPLYFAEDFSENLNLIPSTHDIIKPVLQAK